MNFIIRILHQEEKKVSKTVNNANILGAFVSYGYRDKELLLEKNSNVFDDIKALLHYIKSLNE